MSDAVDLGLIHGPIRQVRTLCGLTGFIGDNWMLHIQTADGGWRFFDHHRECWDYQPRETFYYPTDEYVVLPLPDGFYE